ncbi:hypothetical protein [Sporosarcina sp. YIM B06819]|uniref:hypothetical protein n=1 Tax=Sporosarcina sp. YIM B06819 TaxID=3081769 RepID=UPI00298CE3E8|nr:hypothetical protein [Sporosarcina sp. YIM B06819]
MENVPKTISFRTDEITSEKMEKIKKRVFEGRDVSNALILRTAIDFLYDNYGKGITDTENVFGIVESYIIVTFLKREEFDSSELEEFLDEVQRVYDDCLQEEIEEIAKLYSEETPITIAQLVRFKSRNLPEIFLRIMEVDEVEYVDLSDDELADFLLKKFSEEEFKINASELFNID